MQTSQEKNSQTTVHRNSTPQSRLLEVDRKINVPVDQLFAAFKTPDAVKAWWWPNGLEADRVDINFREGGHYFIHMKNSDKGKAMDQGGGGMTGQFEEIIENKRIVMQDSFADDNGSPISAAEAKIPGEWPEMVYITLDFNAIDDNTSRVHLSQEGIPNEAQKDCIQGWNEMFDKLENYLSSRKQ